MRRIRRALTTALATLALTVATIGVTALPALAGSPHFVDDQTTFTVDGNTLTVQFKEAGLGDETQITVELTGTASCINGGGNHPKAANKEALTTQALVPVQNGQASGSLTLVATLSCEPPMEIAWDGVVLTDVTNNISVTL